MWITNHSVHVQIQTYLVIWSIAFFFLSVMNIQVERGIYDQIFMPKSFYGVYLFTLAIYEFILKLYKQELIFNSIKVVQVS